MPWKRRLPPVPSRHQLLTTVAWKAGDQTDYALEDSVFIDGAVVQWLRDGLGLIKSSTDVRALAASVPDCGDVAQICILLYRRFVIGSTQDAG